MADEPIAKKLAREAEEAEDARTTEEVQAESQAKREVSDRFARLWHEYRLAYGTDSPHLAARHFYEVGLRHGREFQRIAQRVIAEDAEALEILRQHDEQSPKPTERDYSGFPPEDPIYNPRPKPEQEESER